MSASRVVIPCHPCHHLIRPVPGSKNSKCEVGAGLSAHRAHRDGWKASGQPEAAEAEAEAESIQRQRRRASRGGGECRCEMEKLSIESYVAPAG
jgi:hypothetical protein